MGLRAVAGAACLGDGSGLIWYNALGNAGGAQPPNKLGEGGRAAWSAGTRRRDIGMVRVKDYPGSTYWGLALYWYPEFTEGGDPVPQIAKMDFLQRYGMKGFGESPRALEKMDPAVRDRVFQELADRDMHMNLHAGTGHASGDFGDMQRKAEEEIRLIERYVKPSRATITMCGAGCGHRYDRRWPWEERVERVSKAISPISRACWEMGAPLAMENHADFYVSEIVEFIRETPRLCIFLDTANALHIGEDPVRACEEAAPYVIGTHFKDHKMVKGEQGPTHYLVTGCALGDGDADLERQFKVIFDRSAYRDRLAMLFELFAPGDKSLDPVACFEKSVGFVRRMQDGYEALGYGRR